jgi:tRNA-splicing ligase RtcB
MTLRLSDKIRVWLAEPLPKVVAQSLARLAEADDVEHVAVMPDVHLSQDVCVGVALATRSLIYPAAVGSDIGCGMAAIKFRGPADMLHDESTAGRLMSGLYQAVPSLRHGRESAPKLLPEELRRQPLSHSRLEKLKDRDGRVQFGTLGRGNHFLEFQADPDRALWLMVHSGSRGMGQAITSHHLAIGMSGIGRSKLLSLDSTSSAGLDYLNDVAWAESYAAENRLAMIRAAAKLVALELGLEVDKSSLIHGNHNHVRRDQHFGTKLWVHRKGALGADEGQLCVIPGSMGTASFHVAGRGCEDALRSSSHGAGRAMSRSEAATKIGRRQLMREMQGVWFDQRHADALRDEAPSAYKDIYRVMRVQKELTRVVRELRPILSYKGI